LSARPTVAGHGLVQLSSQLKQGNESLIQILASEVQRNGKHSTAKAMSYTGD